MATAHLLPGRQRALLAGRRWAYRSELAGVDGEPAPGDVVRLVDARGGFVAHGWYNPRSQLAVRLLTEDQGEAIDRGFFRRRLTAAWDYRRRVLAADDLEACRVVFSEADLLPGLIVDRFGPVAVVQSLCLGLDAWQPAIVELLVELLELECVYERNDAPVRGLEGLPERRGAVWGTLPEAVTVSEGALRLRADVAGGQKTGHFLDQRLNHIALGRMLGGRRRVLDAFCHTGGFGLQAAAAGAAEVVLLDSSQPALDLALENARLNGLADRVRPVCANAFDQLRAWSRAGERFDCVVLDPPAFAKNRAALDGAYRGYKEINLRALRLLAPGGLLVSCSCSQPVSGEMFLGLLADAAADAGRRLRVIERRSAPPDHPGLAGAEETFYLKCFFCEAI